MTLCNMITIETGATHHSPQLVFFQVSTLYLVTKLQWGIHNYKFICIVHVVLSAVVFMVYTW